MRKNGQSEVIIDSETLKVVNPKKVNEGLIYLKVFLFLALGIVVSSLTCVLFSYIFKEMLYGSLSEDNGFIAFIIIMVVSLIGSFLSSFFVTKNRFPTKKTSISLVCFLLYSFFMGIFTSSFVLYINDSYVLGITLLATSLLVTLMGLIGYLSKGKGLFMALGVISLLLIGTLILYLFTFLLLPLMVTTSFDVTFLWILFAIETVVLASILIYTSLDFFMMKKEILARNDFNNSDCLYYSLVIYSDFIRIFIHLLRIFVILFGSRKRN